MKKRTSTIIKRLLITIFCVFIATSVFAQVSDITMKNLNKALKGETNASHKYELFAKKADSERYKQIAKLFRAVSMSESIHRNNHKAAILILGGKPDIINYDPVKVASTKVNLQGPLKGEEYERCVMYPKFIKQAQADKIPEAIKTFTFAEQAERQHEALFVDALENLGKNKPVDYCVSRISGDTIAVDGNLKCPSRKIGSEDEYIRVK